MTNEETERSMTKYDEDCVKLVTEVMLLIEVHRVGPTRITHLEADYIWSKLMALFEKIRPYLFNNISINPLIELFESCDD